MQQGAQPDIDLDKATVLDIVCDKCKCPYFTPVILLKKISAMDPANNSGQEQTLMQQGNVCLNCKEPSPFDTSVTKWER